MTKRKKREHKLGTIMSLIILLFVVMIFSFIFYMFNIGGQQASIVDGVVETSLVTVKNPFSLDGIRTIISNVLINMQLFKPLLLLVISIIGVGILESSGLLKAIIKPLTSLKPKFVTAIILFISIISTALGEYSFIIIMPLVGAIYKYLNRSSVLGLIISFLGLTIGYGTGLIFNHDTYVLGNLTQIAARADVDVNFLFKLNSYTFILIASTFILTLLGTLIIEKKLVPKFKKEVTEDELIVSKKALLYTLVVFIIMLLILIYMIIPGLPFSGLLLSDHSVYINRLFGEGTPFESSFILIITLIIAVCSYVYGKISLNIKNSDEYSKGLGSYFDKIGYTFILLFILSQIIGVISFTRIGEVIMINMINFISSLSISGIFLIIALIIVVLLGTILIPSTITKWNIASPLIVPLFMRSNITPEFAQFIFTISDGIGASLTPFGSTFIVLTGLINKYSNKEIGIFELIKTILPTVILFIIIWLIIIISWYIVGIPLGIGVYSTL